MATAQEWADGFARQADADFRAWELYEKHPDVLAAACHKLLFLQMACEKLCKAHMIRSGTNPDDVVTTHRVVAKNLPLVIREEMIRRKSDEQAIKNIMRHLRHLSQEIEYLNPAVKDEGQRPDNCEYPWDAGGHIVSPLTWGFSPLRLCFEPAGRTFLKLLRCALDSNLP
jgi:hypothetical protein